MKRNQIILFFSALLALSSFLSCKKGLNETAYSEQTPGNFFSTLGDVNASLLGAYRPLQACCGGYEQAGTFILNSVSDEGNAQLQWGQFDNLTYTPSSPTETHDLWVSTYQSISACNYVLDNESKIKSLDTSANQNYTNSVLGEARFMRAMDYFQLVQMFGGVPLRTTSATRLDQTDLPRASVDSVYSQIITDFKFGEQNLPATNAKGKPTRWAASSFLAKVYLTMQDYKDALTEANNVINNGPYSLQPTYAAVFDVNNKDNSEVIFDIQYVRIDQQGMRMEPLVLGPSTPFAYGASGGWGLSFIENGFYQKYNPADDRINTTFSDPSPGQTTYYAGKWRDPKGVSPDGHGNNFIVYRYADLKLIAAEADNQVNGPDAAAYTQINDIRTRAKLPPLTSGLSKSDFQDSVIQERHLELAYEEIRWFDLKRTGKLKDALIAAGKTWNDRYLLFPIPQIEIDASNGKLTQNPGY